MQRRHRGEQPPTPDEPCGGLVLQSRGSIHRDVQALVDAGLVQSMEGKQRGVRLPEPPKQEPEQLALFGYIAARNHPEPRIRRCPPAPTHKTSPARSYRAKAVR
jgi:SOS-response transcriptional repressor LexA